MRAWKVFPITAKVAELDIHLNKIEQAGFTIHTILPGSFGFTVITFMDSDPIALATQVSSDSMGSDTKQ